MRKTFNVSHPVMRVVVGSASLSKYRYNIWSIDRLFVNEEWRRKGYGTLLMEQVTKSADECGAELRLIILDLGDEIGMPTLERFYKRFGFELIPQINVYRRIPK